MSVPYRVLGLSALMRMDSTSNINRAGSLLLVWLTLWLQEICCPDFSRSGSMVMSIFLVRLNFVSGIARKHLFLPLSLESTTSLLVYFKPSLFASPQIINVCDHLMIVVASFNS